MSLVAAYDSDTSEEEDNKKRKKDKKKKKKKKKKKDTEEDETKKGEKRKLEEDEVKPKLRLPSAAGLLPGAGSTAKFLQKDRAVDDTEAFIDTLNDSDRALQTSKPKNGITDAILRNNTRKVALLKTREKMNEKLAEQNEKREYEKLTDWKRAKIARKDEFGNYIKTAPVDPRGKSIHKWH